MQVGKRAGSHGRKRPVPSIGEVTPDPRAARLDPSACLIAPPSYLRLPRLTNVRQRYAVSEDTEVVLGPLEVLVRAGYVQEVHLHSSKDVVEVLNKAVHAMLQNVWPSQEGFGVDMQLMGAASKKDIEDNFLIFTWRSVDNYYIAMEDVRSRLKGAAEEDRLLASFYWLMDHASSRVMLCFGHYEACQKWENYQEYLADAKENLDEGDEPPVCDMADPTEVPAYIKDADKLRYPISQMRNRFKAIPDDECQSVFLTLLDAYRLSQLAKMPPSPQELEGPTESALYFDGGDCPIGVGLGVNREDGITAWIDQYMQDLFEAGCDASPWIVRSYYAKDAKSWLKFFQCLHKLVELVALLDHCCEITQRWADESKP